MKSQKGITLTSLGIYIVLILIVVAILAVISGTLQGNIKEIYAEGTNNAEIDKFNVYFLKEVKKQGNEISTISNNEIVFILGDKYIFKDNAIYLNDSIKIAENIEKCIFTSNIVNEKTVITVTIKAFNSQEKNIQYVLNNELLADSYNEESNYTDYIPEDWDASKLNRETPVHFEIIDNKIYIVPIPEGFVISGKTTENTIENGLVIYEMAEEEKNAINWQNNTEIEEAKQKYNQFVWIPVEGDFKTSYNALDYLSEPTTLDYDTQIDLDNFYGTNYYKLKEDFDYITHYNEMVTSVNKYNGFYIGRYETTIDENQNIGSKKNATVLTGYRILPNGTRYRWWGLYDSQRNSNVKGNGDYLQTNMIWGQQWDALRIFLGHQAGSIIFGSQTRVLKSGESTYYNSKDIINNIYDLRRNAREWLAEAYADQNSRCFGGGYYGDETLAMNTRGYSPVNFTIDNRKQNYTLYEIGIN